MVYTWSALWTGTMWTIGKYKANLQSGYGSSNSLSPISMPSVGAKIMNASIFGVIIVAVLVIFIVAALVTPVANLTTGVTIAHSGGPAVNPNITQTPGLAPVLQLYPLFFIFVGLLYIAKTASEETRGI
jgi:hypothetical protein